MSDKQIAEPVESANFSNSSTSAEADLSAKLWKDLGESSLLPAPDKKVTTDGGVKDFKDAKDIQLNKDIKAKCLEIPPLTDLYERFDGKKPAPEENYALEKKKAIINKKENATRCEGLDDLLIKLKESVEMSKPAALLGK